MVYGVALREFIDNEIRATGKRPHDYWLTKIGHYKISYQGKYHPITLGGERLFEDDYHGYEKLSDGIWQYKDMPFMFIIDGDSYTITYA